MSDIAYVTPRMRAELESKGHDGIIYKDARYGDEYLVFDSKQIRSAISEGIRPASAAPEEPRTPRTSIKGVNNDTGMRESIAYKQADGKYNYYEVTREYPMGDPDTKIVGMSREEVLRKNEGRRIDAADVIEEPKTQRSGLQGWKDGKWQFGAIAMKDENGKPTGEWRVTTGEDLQDKSLPRDRVTVDSYDEVRKLFGEGGYSRTKRVEEAKELLKDLSGLPEITVEMPGKWARYMADREKASEHIGETVRYEAEKNGWLLPLSMRVDLAKILKIVRIQKDENHLERERLKPLEKEGRELSDKYKRSKVQIENDMIDLAYIDRVNKKINSGLYDPLPEAQEVVTRQIAEAIDNLRKNAPEGSAYRTELEAYARKWKKLNSDMYDYMIKNGLITKEKADAIRMGSDEFYVPIREDDKSTTGHRATGLGAKGTDPILRIVNDWNLQIKRNYENKVKVAAFNAANAFNLKLPNGMKLFEIEPILKYDFDSHGELVQTVESLAMSNKSITAMIDGKPYRMKINAPEALEALEQVPREKRDEVYAAMVSTGAMANSTYGALKTAASPVFALKNPPRDIGTALALTDPRVSRRQFIKSLTTNGQIWKDAFMEATQPWHGKEADSREHEAFISRRGLHGINPLRKNPTVNIDPTIMQRANQWRRRLFGFEEGAITNVLTAWTKIGENITRAAIFDAAMNSPRMHDSVGRMNGTTGEAVRTAIEKGNRGEPTTAQEKELISYMLSEAAAAGKKGTVNFEPKGKASGLMNAMFVFNNAVQRGADTYLDAMGLTKMRGGKNLAERFQRGNRYAQYGTLTALGMGMMAALYAYDHDEDGKYAQMSDQQKDNGVVLGNGKFSIPIPQEFGIPWTLGQVLVDMFKNTRYVNEDMRRSKAITRLMTRVAQTFWPSVPMSDPTEDRAGASAQFGLRAIAPTIPAQIADAATNRNAFGSPIITKMGPEGRPGKDVPLYAHNAAKVSPLARQMSQQGHDWLGMNVAPEINQYMVDQWAKQQADLFHSLPEAFQFLNGVFGEPKRDPETGDEKPNVFSRAFFPTYHPLSYKTDIQDLIDYEASKSHDAGEKHSAKLNMLKQGKERASKLARQQRYKEAEAVSIDTIQRYNSLVQATRQESTR